jgi:type II secretory pathway pseudopilin PulG
MDAAKEKSRLQTGFSMLEAIVVVGVLLALAVGGFFAYGPIVTNAKLAKLKSAASQVYTAATVFQVDGDPTTKPQDALDTWNASSSTIKVGFFDTKVIATPAMTTGEYTPAQGEAFCIQATDIAKPEIEAKSGDCPSPPEDGSLPSDEVLPEEIPDRPLEVLKNGDFSEGLTYWSAIGASDSQATTVTSGVAEIPSNAIGFRGLSQTVSIPAEGITHAEYSYSRVKYSGITTFTVSAFDLAGNLIKELKSHSIPYDVAVPMTPNTVDLTELAGQDIKLAFQVSHNGSGYKVSLDNISVQNINTAASAPTEVEVAVSDTNATVSWNKPTVGSNSVTEYEVTPYRNGESLPILKTTGEPPATSTVFKGLTSGDEYTFKVAAINKLGSSVQSAPSEPYSRPAQMWTNGDFSAGLTAWNEIGAAGTASTVTSGVASISSSANVFRGLSQTVSIPIKGITHAEYSYSRINYSGITLFTVSAYDTSGNLIKEVKRHSIPANVAVPMTLSTVDLTEFAGQDIKLAFQISHNGSGYKVSLDNTSVQTITTAPSAPTNVMISVSDTDATVSWSKPNSGSNSVTEYSITPYRNGEPLPTLKTTGEPPATSTIFKGLTNGGEYTFKVAAINKLGTSAQSTPSAPYNRSTQVWTNGDFSNSLTGWNAIGASGSAATVTAGVASISSSAIGFRGLSQTVSVPTDGVTRAEYSYSRIQYSGITIFTVSAYDPAGNLIKEIRRHSIPSGAAVSMTPSTVDLTEFAGQDIKLAFQVSHNGNGYRVSLDNTSIVTQ